MLRTYGYDRVKMATHLSLDEIFQLRQALIDDPRNANPACAARTSVYLYTKSTHRKLDNLAWAVFHIHKEQQAATATA